MKALVEVLIGDWYGERERPSGNFSRSSNRAPLSTTSSTSAGRAPDTRPGRRRAIAAIPSDVGIPAFLASRMMDLREPPDVKRRVGRPAYLRSRLAAVVVRAAAMGEATGVPPMQQAATVRVPATDRTHSLKKVLRLRLARPIISAECLTTSDQAKHQRPHPSMASHAVYPPMPFVHHRSPVAPRVTTSESLGGSGCRDGPSPW